MKHFHDKEIFPSPYPPTRERGTSPKGKPDHRYTSPEGSTGDREGARDLHELNDHIIQSYIDRFAARLDCYDKQVLQYDRARLEFRLIYVLVTEPVTVDLVRQHLEGNTTLGFPAVDAHGMCKWLCWDADNDERYLDDMDEALKRFGYITLKEGARSGRKGHLWLLLDKPIEAASAIRFEQEIRAHARVPDRALEFFPKQPKANIAANPVRGPLGIHRKPEAKNERGWFDGPTRDVVAQLEWLSLQPLNSGRSIISIAEKLFEGDRFLEAYKCTPARSDSQSELDPVEVFADLNPERRGIYYECLCPGCNQRRAFFYEDGAVLICNRRMSISEDLFNRFH